MSTKFIRDYLDFRNDFAMTVTICSTLMLLIFGVSALVAFLVDGGQQLSYEAKVLFLGSPLLLIFSTILAFSDAVIRMVVNYVTRGDVKYENQIQIFLFGETFGGPDHAGSNLARLFLYCAVSAIGLLGFFVLAKLLVMPAVFATIGVAGILGALIVGALRMARKTYDIKRALFEHKADPNAHKEQT